MVQEVDINAICIKTSSQFCEGGNRILCLQIKVLDTK